MITVIAFTALLIALPYVKKWLVLNSKGRDYIGRYKSVHKTTRTVKAKPRPATKRLIPVNYLGKTQGHITL